jgi:hypothetical protein
MDSSVWSLWWKYFTKVSNDSAKCNLCSKSYSRKGRSTTNLKNHLKSMHKKEYEELNNEQNEATEKFKSTKEGTETPLEIMKK